MTELMIDTPDSAAPPSREAWRMFYRNKAAVAGLIILVFVILMTYLGPILYDQDPTRIVARPLKGPGTEDIPLLGTDYLGRDVLAGVINGGSTTLRVAAVSQYLLRLSV